MRLFGKTCFWLSASVLMFIGFFYASAEDASAMTPGVYTPIALNLDTDNLAYQGYTARHFRVPFHQYSSSGGVVSYPGVTACQPGGVADSFFQTDTGAGGRNDFPVLNVTVTGQTATATVVASGSRSDGCDEFVNAQDRMVATVRSNTGYYLNSEGKLQKTGSTGYRYFKTITQRTLSYTNWASSRTGRGGYQSLARDSSSDTQIPVGVKSYGIRAYTTSNLGCSSRDGGVGRADGTADPYLARTDNAVANRAGSGTYERTTSTNFSATWQPTAASLNVLNEAVTQNSGNWYAVAHFGRCNRNVFLHSYKDIGSNGAGTQAFCPADMHPRGQDGVYVIGASTGRTLSSISSLSEVRDADRYWCRSDTRYQITYRGQDHGVPPPAGVPAITADQLNRAYGRVGCYYTAYTLSESGECEYYHPVPQCTDPVTRRKREWTSTELGTYTGDSTAVFPANTDGTTFCRRKTVQVGFTANPCVVLSLQVYENRPAGQNATPGIISAHRTVTSNTPYNLQVSDPHPATASPTRDTNDPNGCADGTETRADHG